MRKFTEHSEIKEVYESGKYDIFYESNRTKYEIRHLGSTFYCHNVEKNCGMGAVWNFPIENFYAVERPSTDESDPNTESDGC